MDNNDNLPPLRFKVHKKMKTRKQLDALIERRKRQRSGGESAYLIESSGSEFEEFDATKNRLWSRDRSCRCLSFCATALNIVFLVACVITCAALVFVHVNMKNSMDIINGRIQSVEERSVNQEEMDGFITKMQQMETTVASLVTNVTIMMSKINELEQKTTELGAKFESSSQLVDLPKEVEQLKKSVASFGASKEVFELDLHQSKDTLDRLQQTVNRLESAVNSSAKANEELTALRNITSLLKEFEDKYSHNLNNNLLNPETAKGIEEVMRRTIEQYYTENSFDLHSIQLGLSSINSSVQLLWNATALLSDELNEVSRNVKHEERASTTTTREVNGADSLTHTSSSIVPSGPLLSSEMAQPPGESQSSATEDIPETEFRNWFHTLDTNADDVLSESEIQSNLIPVHIQPAELAGRNVTFVEFVELVKKLSSQHAPIVDFEDDPSTAHPTEETR